MFKLFARPKFRGIDIRQRFRLFVTVLTVVVILSLLKVAIHSFGFEFLETSPLMTSAIAGAIFIIGFTLGGALSDYKEAERLPVDLRVSLEAIHDDITCFAERETKIDIRRIRSALVAIVTAIRGGLGHEGDHSDMTAAISAIDRLSPVFADVERLGMPPNFVVRLRSEQNILRKCVFRIYYIQKIQFVPSVHVLVQTLVIAILILITFLQTEGSPASALIFGFMTYMFIYAFYLIGTLEKPFHKGHNSVDDVSLFLLREFSEKISRMNGSL